MPPGKGKDVTVTIVGRDRTERATRSAGRNLDELKRKTRQFDDSSRSVKGLASEFGSLATDLKKSGGPIAALVAIRLAIMALPAVGSLAAGGLILALGGGLATLGLMFAAKNELIRKEFAKTFAGISNTLREISKPFEPVLLNLAKLIRQVFAVFTPALAASFKTMAPAVDRMFKVIATAVVALVPTIGPVTDAFVAMLDSIGPQLPVWVKGISDGIIAIANSIRANPGTFTALIGFIVTATAATLKFIAWLNRLAGWFQRHGTVAKILIAGSLGPLTAALAAQIIVVSRVLGALGRLAGWFRSNSAVTRPLIGALNAAAGAARSFASGIIAALNNAAGIVRRAVAAISAAINSLPLVRTIRLVVDTGAIGRAVNYAQGLLSQLPGFSGGGTIATRAMTPNFATAGPSFAGGPVGGAVNVTTGPTTIVNRVEIPGLVPLIRSVVHDEQSRAATRARYGRAR